MKAGELDPRLGLVDNSRVFPRKAPSLRSAPLTYFSAIGRRASIAETRRAEQAEAQPGGKEMGVPFTVPSKL